MTRALFEKTCKDLDMDITSTEGFARDSIHYCAAETQKAWRLWNAALESKDAVAEPEEPIIVNVDDIHTGQLYFNWGQNKCGFGQMSIGKDKDGNVTAMTECMSRRWSRKALYAAADALIDAAEITG